MQQPYLNYGQCYLYSACGLSLIYHAQNRLEEAQAVTADAITFFLGSGNTTLLTVAQAFQADFALRQGHLMAASQWAQHFVSISSLSPLIQFYDPRITLIKTWLAQATPASLRRADEFLDRLRVYLERTHNRRYLIEILALQALLSAENGDLSNAKSVLAQALEMAQPSRIIRLFVDLGPRMAVLLAELQPAPGIHTEYIDRILAGFELSDDALGSVAAPIQDSPSTTNLLTDREMDVLKLLAERRSDKEIADVLVISLNTVSTHMRNLFSKIDIHTRRQAVARARELGLLPFG